jgi:hypothetical protein
MSSDVSKTDEPHAESAGERESQLARESTDVETGVIYSEFLKSGTGEYLTSRRGKVKIRSRAIASGRGGTITRGYGHIQGIGP